MDEVIGNLGEPLEFTEYRTDDEDLREDGVEMNAGSGQRATEDRASTTYDTDLEGGSSPSSHAIESLGANVEAEREEVSILHAYTGAF